MNYSMYLLLALATLPDASTDRAGAADLDASALDDVLANAALLADLCAGGKTVSRLPHMLRDPPPEVVGDAEVRRLLRHVENLVH